MDDLPPEPPELGRATVEGLVEWLDRMAAWTEADHAVARAHGHEVDGQGLNNLQLYKDASLLLREAYDPQHGFITRPPDSQ
jgi:hypothetical protein